MIYDYTVWQYGAVSPYALITIDSTRLRVSTSRLPRGGLRSEYANQGLALANVADRPRLGVGRGERDAIARGRMLPCRRGAR